MGQSILIAESRELLRIGLRTIFAEDQRVSHIHEATTSDCLKAKLHSQKLDLIIVNQSLVTDLGSLPPGNFVILADKLDMTMLKAVYEHKGRGYLSEYVSADLLRTVLSANQDAFLIEPSFTCHIIDSLLGNDLSTVDEDLLTPREKEIITLVRQGMDKPTIAKTLCIAEATLKTHMKNIANKKDSRKAI